MNRFCARFGQPGRREKKRRGFTLVEILVAITILVLISFFLAAMSDQSARVWNQGQRQIQSRQRARAALDFIGRELEQAVLAINPSNGPLEFVINPTSVSATFSCPNAIFWQAPIATDISLGDLAEVGYFVRWNTHESPSGESMSLFR
jgi:prepilin-type N-terminal cleavage/methylation domain-containing protein